jgi:hypothetical protein
MNSDPERLRALLDELLPSSSEQNGPSSAEVLAMLRHERKRRHRLQAGVALLAIATIALVSLLWSKQLAVGPTVAQAPVEPSPIVIQNVNDEELFALLQDRPTALMALPNGDRRLLVIEPVSPP